MHIEIRQALAADAAILSAIGTETFLETYAAFNTAENMDRHVRENFATEQVARELEDPATIFLLAFLDGEAIGFAKLGTGHCPPELGTQNAIEIERIYVRKAFHGQSAGPQLMQHIVDLVSEKGFEVLWLGVWEHNPRAFRFYEKWGFRKFGEHVFQLGDDAQTDWLLRKDLKG